MPISAVTRIIAVTTTGGLVVGGAVGLLTATDTPAATLAHDAVPVYVCPGEGEVGTLYRGDRILITGRNGDWVAVRHVRGAGERVFINAGAVVADADLEALPEVDCADAGTLMVADTDAPDDTGTPDGTAEVPTGSSTPATPSSPTTTAGSGTTTSAPASTTTTFPPPSVLSVLDNPDPISEQYPGFPNDCPGTGITTVTAAITAPAGVQSVNLSWTSSLGNGSKPMAGGGGSYSATIGAFDANNDPNGSNVTLTYTVKVTDNLGRQHSRQGTLIIQDCTFV